MSEMNEYTPELFELIDEDGNKKQFELIDAAEIDGEEYFAMIPAIEDDDFLNSDCEMVILKSSFDGEEERQTRMCSFSLFSCTNSPVLILAPFPYRMHYIMIVNNNP
mgnify:CR=1 FL=1